MSRLIYATQVGCDWPGGCPAAVALAGPETSTLGLRQATPQGWAYFEEGVMDARGLCLHDFCPEHAARPVEELAALLREGGTAT